jgi:hypothetical protein
MFLQQLSVDKVTYQGEVRGRGAAPRNDGLPDIENETQRFARMREERGKRGREREIERDESGREGVDRKTPGAPGF